MSFFFALCTITPATVAAVAVRNPTAAAPALASFASTDAEASVPVVNTASVVPEKAEVLGSVVDRIVLGSVAAGKVVLDSVTEGKVVLASVEAAVTLLCDACFVTLLCDACSVTLPCEVCFVTLLCEEPCEPWLEPCPCADV